MGVFSMFRRKPPDMAKMVEEWDDIECLENFSKFFERIDFSTTLHQDADGFVTHQSLVMQCGNATITSPPMPFEWPMEPLPFPDDINLKRRLN